MTSTEYLPAPAMIGYPGRIIPHSDHLKYEERINGPRLHHSQEPYEDSYHSQPQEYHGYSRDGRFRNQYSRIITHHACMDGLLACSYLRARLVQRPAEENFTGVQISKVFTTQKSLQAPYDRLGTTSGGEFDHVQFC